MAHPRIELRSVTKRFGARVALGPFSLAIPQGCVVGILGPNGAGKTTVMSIACGLLRPDDGEVRWNGATVQVPFPADVRRQIGVATQETTLYTELTVAQNLRFAADLFGVADASRVEEVIEVVGLADRSGDRVGSLSGGMQRRVALARAMVHDPAFLILDEPTLGVDVEARHALWAQVRSLRRKGKTVLLSTNHLDEAEALCDRVVVLREGIQVAEGDPVEMLSRTGRCVEIDCHDDVVADLVAEIGALDGVRRVTAHAVGLTVHVVEGHPTDAVVSSALALGRAQNVRVRAPDMVEVFQSLTGSADG